MYIQERETVFSGNICVVFWGFVNVTADSTSSQKIFKESVLFRKCVVISCVYGGDSHLKQTWWMFFIMY